jgi:subfamily B ATP-binding cassette protein MsbA
MPQRRPHLPAGAPAAPQRSGRVLAGWLWRAHLRRRWASLAGAFVLMALEGASVGMLSYVIRPMFDSIYPGADYAAVITVAASVAGIFGLRAVAGFGNKVLISRLAEGVSAELQETMLRHVLRLDLLFFQKNPPGELIERIRGDNATVRLLWPGIVLAFGKELVALISLVTVALWIDWRWTLVAAVGLPLVLLPLSMLQKRIRKMATRARDAAGDLTTQLDEDFHGIATIQLTGSEDHEAGRFRGALAKFRKARTRSDMAAAAIPVMFDLVAAAGFAGVMLYGGAEIIEGKKTLGEFMSFFMAMALVFEPLRRLGSVSGQWAQLRISLERMRGLLDAVPRLTSPAAPKPLPSGPIRLAMEKVSFLYDEVPVLCDLDLVAEPGQTTAIVGPSGAGKTTVFQLLTRMADPQGGRVTLNGVDLRDLDLAALRASFAVVSQDSALFDESLADNVRLGARDRSDAALARALADAHATDFVAALPQGAATQAGPRGSALSGGQRQRISIARALLRDAPILLLDEATSALDSQSEQAVTAALARLGQGRTTLVIAHRLATVRQADKIVVMDKGRVVDQGRHEDLLARGGLYADLYRLQFKD